MALSGLAGEPESPRGEAWWFPPKPLPRPVLPVFTKPHSGCFRDTWRPSEEDIASTLPLWKLQVIGSSVYLSGFAPTGLLVKFKSCRGIVVFRRGDFDNKKGVRVAALPKSLAISLLLT